MQAGKDIRIFRLNDFEWYAGADLASVVDFAKKDTGCTDKELLDHPRALSDEEMQSFQFTPEDDNGEVGGHSFREALQRMIDAGQTFPCFFATSA